MKNYFNDRDCTAMFAAAIALACICFAGCASHSSVEDGNQTPPSAITPAPQGGSNIATSVGTAYIPPQVEKIPGYKPPSPYMAAMIAQDEAKDAQRKQ